MKQISDSDFRKAQRLLASFVASKAVNLRQQEERRQAILLLRKWERKEAAKKI